MDHTKKNKTVYACIWEAHESVRKRTQQIHQNKDDEDHVAELEFNSLSHYNLVHEHIPYVPGNGRLHHEISFHHVPEGDVPLFQEAERVQWDEWVTPRSVKIQSPVEAAKIRQQVPRERRLH